jgi:hypothetical protein
VAKKGREKKPARRTPGKRRERRPVVGRTPAKTRSGGSIICLTAWRRRGWNRSREPRTVAKASWSPNTIHDIQRRVRSEEQLIPAPELRIIPEPPVEAVQQRIKQMRGLYVRSTAGQLHGRPEAGVASRYLLSGLVKTSHLEFESHQPA